VVINSAVLASPITHHLCSPAALLSARKQEDKQPIIIIIKQPSMTQVVAP
jgi:hypothetical protein